jgi:uncharacterized membrane protein required for colicin V production
MQSDFPLLALNPLNLLFDISPNLPYTFAMVDLAFLSIVLLFIALGFWTGLLMQVFRLLSLLGAISLSLFASKHLAGIFPDFLQQRPEMRTGLFAFLTFMLAYIAFLLIAQTVVRLFRATAPVLSFMDRVLGAILGACKGIIVSVFLALLILFTTKGDSPLVAKSRVITAVHKQLGNLVQGFNRTLEGKEKTRNKDDD